MRRCARIFFGLAGFGFLALALLPMGDYRAGASNPQAVVVSNVPLPVQGTAAVGNTPGVNVANTASVRVVNTAVPVGGNVQVLNPLDAANNPVPLVVRTSFQPYFDFCIGSGNPNSFCQFTSIPAGMRLVIQAVSFTSRSGTGVNLYRAFVSTTVNGNSPENLYFALSNTGTDQNGGSYQAATISTTLYAGPNSAPECDGLSEPDTTIFFARFPAI